MKLKRLWWNIVGWPDYPPRNMYYRSNSRDHRRYGMADIYTMGGSIDGIALEYNVTRERVRQCLWKVWREYN